MDQLVRGTVCGQPWDVFEPRETAVDDGTLRQAVADCQAHGVESLVLLQTTMSDARLAPTLAQIWPSVPVFWATPENPAGDAVSSCSLVGAHAWASTFRQLGHTFELVYGHPSEPGTAKRLTQSVLLTALVRRLERVRIGAIGGQAPGFFAMSGDLFAMHRGLGVQLQSFSLLEYADVAKGLGRQAVADDVEVVRQLGLPHTDTSDDDLPMASSLYLAMRHFLETENLDCLTIRCWPELPNTFGQWPYLGLARLAEEGRAVACEGDVDGALTFWIGERLGFGRCYLTDWLEHDASTITLWHGGMSPVSLSPPPGEPGGPQIARHFNNKKPAVVDAELKADVPLTLCRIWRFDGKYRLTCRDAHSLRPRRPLMGTNALARLDCDPHGWFEELCYAGMPHHLAVFEGHHSQTLRRLARLLEMEIV
jgi:L-arabinose isomerase